MESELEKLFDQANVFFSPLEAKAHCKAVNVSSSRPSLMHVSTPGWKPTVYRLASFGPHPSFLVEAGSSDEASDDELSFPSVRKVTESILDSQFTNITVLFTQDAPTQTRYHSPALIVFNLDKRKPLFQVKSALLRLAPGVLKVIAVDFASDTGFVHCGVVYFSTLEEATFMYTKLSKYERRGKLGSKLQRIPGAQIAMSVRWFTYKVLDVSLDWTSVVLRGLRLDVSKREIEETYQDLILRSEQPREINAEMCTIVIVKSLSEADQLIKKYPSSKLGGKADIHPFSSVFKNPEQSAEIVFNEYRKKRKMLMQSPGINKILKINDGNSESEDARSLISSVSGTVEDGEITDTDAPSSDTTQNFYMILEHAGSYINADGEVSSHSGVYIKTILSLPNNANNFK